MPELKTNARDNENSAGGRALAPASVEAAIRTGVLAALGQPPGLYRVAVLPLWGSHYRVNVLTGTDPTAVRVAHSYFVAVGASGAILAAEPRIARLYA